MTREEIAQDDVLLRAAEQPRSRRTAKGCLAAQHREPERLMRARERLGRRARQPRGQPVAQSSGGEPGRSEDQALVGGEPQPVDPIEDHLDGHGRGARARPAEHPCDRGVQREGSLLLRVEGGRLDDERWCTPQGEHALIPSRATDTPPLPPPEIALARSSLRAPAPDHDGDSARPVIFEGPIP